MACNVTPFPRLPKPPREIDVNYLNDVVRA